MNVLAVLSAYLFIFTFVATPKALASEKISEQSIYKNFETACLKYKGDMDLVAAYMQKQGAFKVEQYDGEVTWVFSHNPKTVKSHKIGVNGTRCILEIETFKEDSPNFIISVSSLKDMMIKKLKMKSMPVPNNTGIDTYALKYGGFLNAEKFMISFDGILPWGRMRVVALTKKTIEDAAESTGTQEPEWP